MFATYFVQVWYGQGIDSIYIMLCWYQQIKVSETNVSSQRKKREAIYTGHCYVHNKIFCDGILGAYPFN